MFSFFGSCHLPKWTQTKFKSHMNKADAKQSVYSKYITVWVESPAHQVLKQKLQSLTLIQSWPRALMKAEAEVCKMLTFVGCTKMCEKRCKSKKECNFSNLNEAKENTNRTKSTLKQPIWRNTFGMYVTCDMVAAMKS